MPIFLDALGLAYFDAPKCACTTVKLALYEIEKGAPFAGSADAEGRGIHAYWADRGFGHAILVGSVAGVIDDRPPCAELVSRIMAEAEQATAEEAEAEPEEGAEVSEADDSFEDAMEDVGTE